MNTHAAELRWVRTDHRFGQLRHLCSGRVLAQHVTLDDAGDLYAGVTIRVRR